MLLSKLKTGISPVALALLTAPVFVGCSDFMHDDLPQCNHDLHVRLSYIKNMAFEERVADVPGAVVYAFDKDGKLAGEKTVTADELAASDYVVRVPVQKEGDYRIVVWGGLGDGSPFQLDGTRAVSTLDDITCRLNYETNESGHHVNKQHLPALYHGWTSNTFRIIDTEPEVVINNLTKNTNYLTVTIHNKGSKALNAADFTFVVTDDNAVMGHDNSITKEAQNVQYHPVSVEAGKFAVSDGQGGTSQQLAESVVALIPLARLMEDSDGRLYVYRGTEEIVNVSVTELLLSSKKHEASQMDDQEYLDRQDTYSASFFITDDGYLIKSLIYVNDWAVVNQDIDF